MDVGVIGLGRMGRGMAQSLVRAGLLDLLTSTLFASPVYKGYGASIAAGRYEPPGFSA